jgi:predicted GNAT family acetyltransferase
MLKVRAYHSPQEFREAAKSELETRESANCLILGVCGQVERHPERFQQPVLWKTVGEGKTLHLAAMMTPPHRLLLTGRTDRAAECVALLANALLGEGWNIPGVFGPAGLAREMAARLAERKQKEYHLDQNLRLYDLTKVRISTPAGGRLLPAGEADYERIAAWWYDARLEMMGKAEREECRQTVKYRMEDGDVFLWDTGEPVSMAAKTRPTKHGISIGMVFTPRELRRRGYATACVAELSRSLLSEGWEYCALYADLANPASNRIYQRIGYRPVCDFEEYEFI